MCLGEKGHSVQTALVPTVRCIHSDDCLGRGYDEAPHGFLVSRSHSAALVVVLGGASWSLPQGLHLQEVQVEE